MNKTITQPSTTLELLTEAQASTNTYLFSALEPSDTATIPTFTELLKEYKASIDKPKVAWDSSNSNERADPFAIYKSNLATAKPQPVRWLWQKRLPLSGITLLDGDHGSGKSHLALQIAACVSSGTSMPDPDGTSTIQGGIVIVSANTDATRTQLQHLTALGADLSRIEILSYIKEPENTSHPSSHRPFSFPEDLTHLFDTIKRVDARLVILDPFIDLLSHDQRWTDRRLSQLLANLHQRLIACNVACILIRNCGAKGSHARPTILERSDHFLKIAVSRMLLAPDPMQPDHLLLSHALNRYSALTQTCTLQIQPLPDHPDLPHITCHGYHILRAKDLIENRPDTLHRRLLAQRLLRFITKASDPIHVSTLYALHPNSSPFQIQRALSDLLRTQQIQRPARGFYTPAPDNPVFPPNTTATTTPNTNTLNSTAAITPVSEPASFLNTPAAITPIPELTTPLNTTATITSHPEPVMELNPTPTTTSIPQPTSTLNTTATITSQPKPVTQSNSTPATTLKPKITKRPHQGRNKHRNTKKRH